MRVSKVVHAVNLRYAIGELLLIVVSILIALAISDWHERGSQRERELLLLDEIRTALHVDVASLELDLQSWTDAAGQAKALIEVLKTEPPYEPSMDLLFGAVYGLRPTNLNTAPYETLKSIGLQAVSNRELRSGIAKVYDHHFEKLSSLNDIESQVIFGVMRPYYLTHFSNLVFLKSATPVDYDAVIRDTYYRNIVDYRLTIITANQMVIYSQAIDDIRSVLAMLNEELTQ